MGPSEDRASRVSNVGVAAHIAAASVGGPRHDPAMTPEERAGEANGFWACQTHAKAIDDAPSTYTVEQLRRLKAQHEGWVFDRLVATGHAVGSGLSRVEIGNVGIFKDTVSLDLGRHNVLVSGGSCGKTTVCQAVAAFSGREHLEVLRSRFDFMRGDAAHRHVGATTIVDGRAVRVKLMQRPSPFAARSKRARNQLHVEVNGGLCADWPRHLFRVICLDAGLWMDVPRRIRRPGEMGLERFLSYMAGVTNNTEDGLWSMLRPELFASSTFGYVIERTSHRAARIRAPDRDFFLDASTVGPTELTLVFLDIAFKLIESSRTEHPWVVVIDTVFFSRLDAHHRKMIYDALFNMDEPRIQSIVCVSDDRSLEDLRALRADRWVGATTADRVTLHRFL